MLTLSIQIPVWKIPKTLKFCERVGCQKFVKKRKNQSWDRYFRSRFCSVKCKALAQNKRAVRCGICGFEVPYLQMLISHRRLTHAT